MKDFVGMHRYQIHALDSHCSRNLDEAIQYISLLLQLIICHIVSSQSHLGIKDPW